MAGTFQENKRIANQIVSCYNIQKSEGSRGGKVIGHTKSGKAIYATTNIANSKYHKDWTSEKSQEILDLKEKFSNAQFFYVTDSSTLTVEQVNNLRRLCFNQGIELS